MKINQLLDKILYVSFLSPVNILKKEIYYFEQYLKNFDFQKSLEKYTQFMHFISYKYNLDFNNLSSIYMNL